MAPYPVQRYFTSSSYVYDLLLLISLFLTAVAKRGSEIVQDSLQKTKAQTLIQSTRLGKTRKKQDPHFIGQGQQDVADLKLKLIKESLRTGKDKTNQIQQDGIPTARSKAYRDAQKNSWAKNVNGSDKAREFWRDTEVQHA